MSTQHPDIFKAVEMAINLATLTSETISPVTVPETNTIEFSDEVSIQLSKNGIVLTSTNPKHTQTEHSLFDLSSLELPQGFELEADKLSRLLELNEGQSAVFLQMLSSADQTQPESTLNLGLQAALGVSATNVVAQDTYELSDGRYARITRNASDVMYSARQKASDIQHENLLPVDEVITLESSDSNIRMGIVVTPAYEMSSSKVEESKDLFQRCLSNTMSVLEPFDFDNQPERIQRMIESESLDMTLFTSLQNSVSESQALGNTVYMSNALNIAMINENTPVLMAQSNPNLDKYLESVGSLRLDEYLQADALNAVTRYDMSSLTSAVLNNKEPERNLENMFGMK